MIDNPKALEEIGIEWECQLTIPAWGKLRVGLVVLNLYGLNWESIKTDENYVGVVSLPKQRTSRTSTTDLDIRDDYLLRSYIDVNAATLTLYYTHPQEGPPNPRWYEDMANLEIVTPPTQLKDIQHQLDKSMELLSTVIQPIAEKIDEDIGIFLPDSSIQVGHGSLFNAPRKHVNLTRLRKYAEVCPLSLHQHPHRLAIKPSQYHRKYSRYEVKVPYGFSDYKSLIKGNIRSHKTSNPEYLLDAIAQAQKGVFKPRLVGYTRGNGKMFIKHAGLI